MSSNVGGDLLDETTIGRLAAERDRLAAEVDLLAEPDDGEDPAVRARLCFLIALLDRARPQEPAGPVAEGLLVTVRFGDDAEHRTFLYGAVSDRGTAHLTICPPESRLGAALAGRVVGDRVSYVTPQGATMPVEVVAVTRRPDDAVQSWRRSQAGTG